MALFLEKYVLAPIQKLLDEVPDILPDFAAHLEGDQMTILVAGEPLIVRRMPKLADDESQGLPDDADSQIPGP
jgi:hypothetical protein